MSYNIDDQINVNKEISRKVLAPDWLASHLMPDPGVGDLRAPPVPQHAVLHALHTGVLSHLGAVCRLVVLHLCGHATTAKYY